MCQCSFLLYYSASGTGHWGGAPGFEGPSCIAAWHPCVCAAVVAALQHPFAARVQRECCYPEPQP